MRPSPLRKAVESDYPGWCPGGVAQLAERYVRNVEAEGSNPFTSTERPRSEAPKWDPPEFSFGST